MSTPKYTYTETSVTPEFRGTVLAHFAHRSQLLPCWRLLDHLLFGTVFDNDQGLLMLPCELLERFRNGQVVTKNFNAGKLLAKFNEGFFAIRHRPHSTQAKKVRMVEEVRFPAWLIEARDRMFGEPPSSRTVRFVSGEPVGPTDVLRSRLEALGGAPEAKSPMAQDVLDHLNGLDPDLFAHLPARVREARKLVDSLKPGCKIVQLGQLAGIHACPKPLYKAVTNSARLYPCGASFLNLKSSVRDVFTAGWIKLDLRQAQFGILSTIWQADGLRSYLDGLTGSVWDDLMDRSDIPVTSDNKGAIKQATYSILYGAYEHNVRYRLKEEVGTQAADRFLSLPIVQHIFEQREERITRLRSEFGVFDAYGIWRELGSGGNARERRRQSTSLLACQAQSYELPILHPLIEYSRSTAGTDAPFTVTAWLHDGVWATCNPESADRHIAHVRELVRASSTNLLGFGMELDVELPCFAT